MFGGRYHGEGSRWERREDDRTRARRWGPARSGDRHRIDHKRFPWSAINRRGCNRVASSSRSRHCRRRARVWFLFISFSYRIVPCVCSRTTINARMCDIIITKSFRLVPFARYIRDRNAQPCVYRLAMTDVVAVVDTSPKWPSSAIIRKRVTPSRHRERLASPRSRPKLLTRRRVHRKTARPWLDRRCVCFSCCCARPHYDPRRRSAARTPTHWPAASSRV